MNQISLAVVEFGIVRLGVSGQELNDIGGGVVGGIGEVAVNGGGDLAGIRVALRHNPPNDNAAIGSVGQCVADRFAIQLIESKDDLALFLCNQVGDVALGIIAARCIVGVGREADKVGSPRSVERKGGSIVGVCFCRVVMEAPREQFGGLVGVNGVERGTSCFERNVPLVGSCRQCKVPRSGEYPLIGSAVIKKTELVVHDAAARAVYHQIERIDRTG